MISSLRGTVLSVGAASAVIDVGGVGFGVAVSPSHAAALRQGAEAVVNTVLIVREDDLSLFGFVDVEHLRMFDLLRGVTGVGPKSAMGVISVMTPDDIAEAVNTENDAAFRKVPGIGPKTAKLIVVSLAGKLVASSGSQPKGEVNNATAEVVNALIGLGWSEKAALTATESALASGSADKSSVPAILRLALATLGPGSHAPSARGKS